MNLPTLIFVAVAIPLTIIAALLLMSKSMESLNARPALRRRLYLILGILYLGIGVGEVVTRGWREFVVVQLILGVAWIGTAVYEWRKARGTSTELAADEALPADGDRS